WAGAAAAWQRLGQPYRAAYAGFRQAEALLAGPGDRDSAAGVLGRAAAITGRLGAPPLDGGGQAPAPPAPPRPPPPPPPPAPRPAAPPAPAGRPAARRAAGPDPARGRGAPPGRGWAQQPPDRPGIVYQPQDRQRPRLQHPCQARRRQPGGGRCDCPPPRPGLRPVSAARSSLRDARRSRTGWTAGLAKAPRLA